jgi:probable HAF family extracellular repeat protein
VFFALESLFCEKRYEIAECNLKKDKEMKKLTGLLCALALFFPVLVLAIPTYIFHDLGVPSGAFSMAYGINESGQVAGISGDHAVIWENGTATILGLGYATDINDFGQVVGGHNGAVLWENGIMTNLGAPGGERSWSSGINNLGQISIYSSTTDEVSAPYHAYMWDPVIGIIDLDTTGYSYAYDINDNGIVVGRFYSTVDYPAFWQKGVMTQIGTSSGQAHAINNLNQVVGVYVEHAFLWDEGSITNLGTLGADISEPWAINDTGQVVGKLYYQDEHAFLWQDGKMYDLNELVDTSSDYILTSAYDINNKGQIVGTAELYGVRHGFLLDPVPEPPDPVGIDIMPRTCPNECPIKGGGFVEVAILGTLAFDVNDIDIASVRLEGVTPIRSRLKDKSSPVVPPPTECECTAEGRDGFIDLCLKFDKKEILSALGEVDVGDSFVLTLTGSLNDGTPIEGRDCIVMTQKGKKN